MPSAYAHFKFGREVYAKLPQSIKQSVDISRQLYDIGLHGPDILFYYNALKSNRISKTGHAMHEASAGEFFNPALEILSQAKKDEGGKAYVYGFLCHYILDSCCHWYVEDAIEETGVPHTWIEGDFDRMLMMADGLNPVSYMTASHIVPSEENARIISQFLPDISKEETYRALKDMVFYSNLLVCRTKAKRSFALNVLKLTGNLEGIGGMIISPHPDSKCRKSTENLNRLFTAAIDEAVKYLGIFESAIEEQNPLPERLMRTFGPDKESKEEYEVYKA